uniref:Uncharacterized protein n=1 Tax=Parascaris univalens TaxID=6257 RepID=A0A915BIL0_PARUN
MRLHIVYRILFHYCAQVNMLTYCSACHLRIRCDLFIVVTYWWMSFKIQCILSNSSLSRVIKGFIDRCILCVGTHLTISCFLLLMP